MMPYIYKNVRSYMEWMLEGVGRDPQELLSSQLFSVTVVTFLKCALPLLLTALVLGILAHGTQTRFNVSFQVVKPNSAS